MPLPPTKEQEAQEELAHRAQKHLTMDQLRGCIPPEAFVKSLPRSMWYLARDYAGICGSACVLSLLRSSAAWGALPVAVQWAAIGLHWLVAGFFMWCLFVVGHDCGHGSFSDYRWLNELLGNLTHGSILVPYWPWRLSHHRHHLYHNHVHKDYSFQWDVDRLLAESPEAATVAFGAERAPSEAAMAAKRLQRSPVVLGLISAVTQLLPCIGWPVYLLGLPTDLFDGSHFVPWPTARLWKGTPRDEYVKCIVSTAVVAANAWTVYRYLCGGSLATMFIFYLAPVLVCGWWLVCVTYLQHHDPETQVYGELNWRFVYAAFETVDRRYGFGIDHLHHNITDGHVAHHLFFRAIPHYNLPLATRAIRTHLQKHGLQTLYKFEETPDFAVRVFRYLRRHGMRAKLAPAHVLLPSARQAPAEAKKAL